jgi:predicted MFS family arabinose efflux permease
MEYAHLPANQHGWVYLPIVLGGFIAAVPAIIIAEKRRKIKQVFVFGIGLMALSLLVLAQEYQHYGGLLFGISLFFIAFNLLEALLPSLLSKIAPAGSKATAMGIYSSSQFLGAFFGGVCGGLLWAKQDISLAYMMLALLMMVWLILALFMQKPRFLQSMMINIPLCDQHQTAQLMSKLQNIMGVEEAVILAQEGIVYLKVDNKILDACRLHDTIYDPNLRAR